MKRKKSGNLTIQQRDNIWGYAFILPCVIIFAIFTIYPFCYSAFLSMQEKVGTNITDLQFAGGQTVYKSFSKQGNVELI